VKISYTGVGIASFALISVAKARNIIFFPLILTLPHFHEEEGKGIGIVS